MIISKQKYIRVLERTIKSYPKKIRNKLFPYFWSPLQIEEKTGLSVVYYKGKDRKLVFSISDKGQIGTFKTLERPYYLPAYVRTNWPTLPLWKKAIQDAVKVRLIQLMEL